MFRHFEHLGILIEVFYLESGLCYAAFEITSDYETDYHETAKEAVKQAVERLTNY